MSDGLVSILMNCYNGEKYLEEAINSVLNQTYKNWEFVYFNHGILFFSHISSNISLSLLLSIHCQKFSCLKAIN